MHRAAATGTLGDPRITGTLGDPRTSDIVRGHLERGLADRLPDGVRGAGQKGGNYPGLITNAVTLRRADGTVGVSVLSLSGMPRPDYQELLAAGAVLSLSQQVLLDEQLWERLRTELAER